MWKLILAIIAIVFILKYGISLIKRAILISRVKKECKEKGLEFKKCKNLFKSVFICDGSADFEVGNAVVHIFTPFYRRVRYSFSDDRRLEVMVARVQSGVVTPYHVPKGTYTKTIATIRNNKLKKLGNTDDGKKHILLIYPIPFEVTRVEGNKTEPAYSGDEIWDNCIFSNKSYFLENIEELAEQDK